MKTLKKDKTYIRTLVYSEKRVPLDDEPLTPREMESVALSLEEVGDGKAESLEAVTARLLLHEKEASRGSTKSGKATGSPSKKR